MRSLSPPSGVQLPAAPRQPMPWFSLAAPVIGSLVLWLATKQPTVLLFALLGPVAMLGSRWDARRAQRQAALHTELQREGLAEHQPDALSERMADRPVLRAGELVLGTDAGGRAVVAESSRLVLRGEVSWRESLERYLQTFGWPQQKASLATAVPPVFVDLLPEIGRATVASGSGEIELRCALLNAASVEQSAACTELPDEPSPPKLNLLTHGPHAWLMGMTGSGKTELLLGWLLEMAENHSPTNLNILLIDFKGGGSYRVLEELPHCVGLITDLDDGEAKRVLSSLRAELTRREVILHEAALGDVAELSPHSAPARLVIVVDEFRAMLDTFADMRTVFADIAARGRALGVHLILSSQRATGAAGDALLANCALRISMRVTDALESQLVLGSPRAAQLAHVPGRGVAVGTGLELTEFQAVWASAEEKTWRVTDLASSYADHNTRRRPWLPALPTQLTWAEVIEASRGVQDGHSASALLGRSDHPELQQQPAALYVPERDGHLLIRGPAQSGKTSAAQVVSTQLGAHVSVEVHDDLDLTLANLSWDRREQFITELTRKLRTAPKSDVPPVVICWPAHLVLPPWLEACRARLDLTGENPGRASWQGLATQLVVSVEQEGRVRGIKPLP